MAAKKRKPRPTKLDRMVAADPVLKRLFDTAAAKREEKQLAESRKDAAAIEHLVKRLDGRIARRIRSQRTRLRPCIIRRDPRDVVLRYLRRFRGGIWYCGGSHVARLNYGPGIGFRGWVNDQPRRIRPVALNLSGIQSP